MRKYAIITDSTSDLNHELRTKYQIDYCQMNINNQGKEYPASLDWEIYSAKELYDWMRDGISIKTTQVPYKEFYLKFKSYLEQDMDILYLSCSSALSGSINTALSVKNELIETYPDAKIYCVDSLISTLGQGLLTIEASKLRESGKTIEEVVAWLEEHRLEMNQIATVSDLEYLKRAGRIKTSKAFFGNLFNVKPLIISDVIGQNYAFKKVKGRKSSLDALVSYAKETIVDAQNQVIGVAHADCLEDALYIKEQILKEIPCKDVIVDFIGPIVGSSVGPGTVGIYYMGQKVTIQGE